MCQMRVVEKLKTHILCLVMKIMLFIRYVGKYGEARQATDYNIIQRTRFACSMTKATDTQT